MPRTPLLRSLQRLAREHLVAEQRGVPVEAVRTAHKQRRTAGRGLTRRQFLAGAAVATLGLPRAAIARGSPRVAIVGGGIAGLSCALRLADAGVAATVYEASGRIGGRIFSNRDYWDEGQVSEWYGEFIDSSHETMLALAQRFGLPLIDLHAAEPPGSADLYHFFGRYYAKDDADRDFQRIRRALRQDNRDAGYPTTFTQSTPHGRMLDRMSVFDWIEWRVPGGHDSALGALLDLAYTTEYAAESTDQSALNIVYLLGAQPQPGKLSLYGESDEAYRIAGGNQQLPEAMARHLGLGTVVQTGHRLASLRRTAGGAYDLTFHTGGGSRLLRADLVVLTVPFAVLRSLDIERAGFDARKLRVIRELGRGCSAKLHLQFCQRSWNGRGPWPGRSHGSSYSDRDYQTTWESTRGQSGTAGILNNFTGGDTVGALRSEGPFGTAANARVRADAEAFLRSVDPVYPGLKRHWNGKATISLPHRDRYAGLSYSYWRIGQYQELAGYEAVPQGGVYFAGEHTSLDYQGYMEGGASSGVRAAEEVLLALGRS